MSRVIKVAFSTYLLVCLAGAMALAAPGGITISVTGGKQSVTNAVVERELDLAGAAKALEITGPVDPGAVRVVEVGKVGNLPSQVDPSGAGKYTVCWQVPGELVPGKTRVFRVLLNGEGGVPAPSAPVAASRKGDDVVVTSGNIALTYSKDIGGLLSKLTVGGVSASFSWMDKIYDGSVYYLANHAATQTRLIASGPLRVVYETQSAYEGSGKPAESRPRATYRFTHYAGEPLARLDARVTQDFAHSWMSLHVVEIQFAGPPIDSYITDSASGAFKQTGQFIGGPRWAALYGPGLLIGVIGGSVGIYDGGGPYYGSYARGSVETLSKSEYETHCALYFGSAPSESAALTASAASFSSLPSLRVSLDALDRSAQEVRATLAKRSKSLDALKGSAWVSAYAQVTVAGNKLAAGVASLGAGDFGKAEAALREAKSLLTKGRVRLESSTRNGVIHGVVDGYPFVSNPRAAYLFTRANEGFGLISIYDREKKREYLAADPKRAMLWQISVKQGGSGRVITSLNPTIRSVKQTKSGLELVWKGDIQARVSLVLPKDSPRLTMRLAAKVLKPGLGIQTVSFPEIAGILPLTPGAKDDVILSTSSVGDLRPSPLVSGSSVRLEYPNCMQFTAVQGGNAGFYTAEQDPQANVKAFSWDADTQSGALIYAVSHPVLGWASDTPVTSYKSPGDVVVGPFHGDWFDACQVYREWALTAPWSAKGPIYKRGDYPKWLADAPYWTIGYLDSEDNIKNEVKKFEYYGLPASICHTYGYYFPQTQDDRYPEYFPPKLGSENLKRVVKELHAKGMRFVPYINGWCWDQDTESYTVEDADSTAAIQTSDGGHIVMDSYGYGQKLAGMCPGAAEWRKQLVNASKELVGRYDFDGVYYDFLTIHTTDCFNKSHGHPISGGNYWTAAIRQTYAELRSELKKIRPDAMMTGEDNAEFVIDLFDTQFSLSQPNNKAPMYNAVYHGYTLLYGGGKQNYSAPCAQGRWWITGGQNGWTGAESAFPALQHDPKWKADGEFFRRLLHCHYYFARPYLAYGTMLRPPKVSGNVPMVSAESGLGPFSISAIDGTAWKAPDGSVGIFFLNYGETPLKFGWFVDLAEYAGWGKGAKVKITRWTEDRKLTPLAVVPGGKLTRRESLEGRGLIALKLEVVK